MNNVSHNKMVILTSYFDGESYGLLGPQMAATLINDHSEFHCIVVAVTRNDDQAVLKRTLRTHFGSQQPIVGFSSLSGRKDLFDLARELNSEGAITILAGPQAGIDFMGEIDWRHHSERFQGYHSIFNYALQGPAEQILPLLDDMSSADPASVSGLLYETQNGISQNQAARWRSEYLNKVDWSLIYRTGVSGLVPLPVSSAQVLQQIGCPHAAKTTAITIDAPAFMPSAPAVNLHLKGCSFCDVAVDKGFCGAVSQATVLEEIINLPPNETGRKIPFELIDENPFTRLPKLLITLEEEKIAVSQINLTTRADYLLRGEKYLMEALRIARNQRIRIICVSVGFESFDDRILNNLNKGITVADNLNAVMLMRRLKRLFPFQWGYARQDGGNHGLIHPTPWDTPQNAAGMEALISAHHLAADILPAHSTPLIIHHGSGLGEWIRRLEKHTGNLFHRSGGIIEWWEKDERFAENR